ncbi:esterase-like activity of phytase family protein [Saccharothrix violaceirubra]|uniref:Phytase-like domain-containing protein n=1 Tax=Saccharothrix violaceirubra TaxID=413306 RepID=A0A7W7T861_9PSEU|nr:esterase-like activity of phytase family protein [Saccharothrix violaceirubra]MBB4967050.1 hypothetical protein [Saccharothrix violaceirubra]
MRSLAVLGITAVLIAVPTTTAQAAPAPITVPGYEFSLIGEYGLAGLTRYQGTVVGGITGADYDQATGEFRLLSGDRDNARFYTGSLSLSGACPKPKITGVSRLRGTSAGVDPQALRYDTATGNVLWADAGSVTKKLDPSVREADKKGNAVARFATPDVQKVGVQKGLSLSGLALTVDGVAVLTTTRGPLAQDGTLIRFTLHDRASGDPLVQFAYGSDTGAEVTELLAVTETRFLVLERTGRDAKLYEVDFANGATNIADVPALAGEQVDTLSKRLVLDVSRLGVRTDELEALTWGPVRADGARSLIFVSDNHLKATKRTQLIAVKAVVS